MIHTDKETLDFINKNLDSDVNKLLLNASKYPSLDIPFIVNQIISRKAIKTKLPSWSQCPEIIIPSKISTEQCSSENTAMYKAGLIKGGNLCDLTGGMGIDSYYFSLKTDKVTYIERFEDYCDAAKHNFKNLNADNIEVVNSDSREYIDKLSNIDVFYIDPARRSDSNKRIFAINECEPDVLSIKDILLDKAKTIIIKVSPMADIHFSLSLLPEATEVHCVSVKNECKELIFILDRNKSSNDIKVFCVNFDSNNDKSVFIYNLNEERDFNPQYTNKVLTYLYEPNSSIMKAGAFKSVCKEFNVLKLGVNTHLYTSDTLITDFPGRIFKVESVTDFTSSNLKLLKKEFAKANITTRNFFLSVDEIRKKTGIKEGGSDYLFFTTISKDQRIVIKSHKTGM